MEGSKEAEEGLSHPSGGGLCFPVLFFVCFAELGMNPGPCTCQRSSPTVQPHPQPADSFQWLCPESLRNCPLILCSMHHTWARLLDTLNSPHQEVGGGEDSVSGGAAEEVGPSLWVRRPHTALDRTLLCGLADEPFESSGIWAVHA